MAQCLVGSVLCIRDSLLEGGFGRVGVLLGYLAFSILSVGNLLGWLYNIHQSPSFQYFFWPNNHSSIISLSNNFMLSNSLLLYSIPNPTCSPILSMLSFLSIRLTTQQKPPPFPLAPRSSLNHTPYIIYPHTYIPTYLPTSLPYSKISTSQHQHQPLTEPISPHLTFSSLTTSYLPHLPSP